MRKLGKREYLRLIILAITKAYGNTLLDYDTDLRIAEEVFKSLKKYLFLRKPDLSQKEWSAFLSSRGAAQYRTIYDVNMAGLDKFKNLKLSKKMLVLQNMGLVDDSGNLTSVYGGKNEIEKCVRSLLEKAEDPISPRSLIKRIKRKMPTQSNLDIKTALWKMLDEGVIQLSSDRLLSLKSASKKTIKRKK